MDTNTKTEQPLSRLFETIEKRKDAERERLRKIEDEKLRRLGNKIWWSK